MVGKCPRIGMSGEFGERDRVRKLLCFSQHLLYDKFERISNQLLRFSNTMPVVSNLCKHLQTFKSLGVSGLCK